MTQEVRLLSARRELYLGHEQDELIFNPNGTGWGQNWPRQIGSQIPDKIFMYVLVPDKKNTYFSEMSYKSFWTSDKTSENDVSF